MRDLQMPIGVDEVTISGKRREVDPAAVNRLAKSIEEIGLKHPITVRRKGEQYILVAGLHRLEAHKKLNLEHIPANIVSMTNAEARMWEIAENLHRAELTKLERAEQIEEWRKLSVQVVQSKHPADHGVSAAAETLGVSRADIKRAEAIASISEEAKDAAEEAGIDDNQSKLLAVAREPEERQVAKVIELSKGPLQPGTTWRDQFERLWAKGTEDDHAWALDHIDRPIMDRRHG